MKLATKSPETVLLITTFIGFFAGAAAQCDNGWTQYNNHCYFLNSINLNFSQASAYCTQQNSYIADILSAEENDYIVQNVLQPQNTWAYIGLNNPAGAGSPWVWANSGETAVYTNWANGQPTYAGGAIRVPEQCVEMGRDTYNYQWNDLSCSITGPSLCKKAQEIITVSCNSHTMAFYAAMNQLNIQSESGLSLNEPICHPTTQGSWLYLAWNLTQCGNVITYSGNKTTYTNTLQTNNGQDAVITRSNGLTLTISCTFENNVLVSSGGFQPSFPQEQTIVEQGFGEYTVRLDVTDSSYNTPITNYPIQVGLGDLIYFHLSVQSSAALDIFAVQCYATPQASATSTPQYEILKEDCPQDSTLFINSSTPESIKFGMEAFKFLGDYQYVYVHCEVIVCHTSQSGSRCSQGCVSVPTVSTRKRRQTADGSFFGGSSKHVLMQGPFKLSHRTTGFPQTGSESSGAVCLLAKKIPFAAVLLVAAMLAFATAL